MALDPRYADAISGIESGGKYSIVGPATRTGDHAYGRYQVMGSNIPSWTKQYYGKSLTPQEFLANPEAQDAVFQGKFGEYTQKYGPEAASRAWFAGEGGMNNPNAKDVLGTTVQSYGERFSKAIGQPQAAPLPPPVDVASAPTIAPPISGPQGPAPTQQARPQQGAGLVPNLAPFSWTPQPAASQQMQPSPQTPLLQNQLAQMAMLQPPPDTRGLQGLLQNSAPVFRGLLS